MHRHHNNALLRVCRELDDIGIKATFVDQAAGFLPGIRIVAGKLHVGAECRIGDLLHEAGHLAIMPSRYRAMANDNLKNVMKYMLGDVARRNLHPDSPLYRAVIQCSDPEATAWAFAFGRRIGLEPDVIIEDDQYPDERGAATGAGIRLALSLGRYLGINGLAHAGFCSVNRFGRLPQYPELATWTQEADL